MIKFKHLALSAIVATIANTGIATAEKLTVEQVANLTGPDRQKVLESCAREEGSVNIYSSLIVNQALRPMVEAYESKYPGIKTGYVRETGGGLLQKLTTEARASRPVASVIEATGIDALARQANLTTPFKTPYADSYPEELKGSDWVASRLSYFGASYNTDKVKSDELPDSYAGFADPRWKGMLVWSSQSTGAPLMITGLRKFYGDDKAYEILSGLARNDIASVSVNQRQVVNQVMAGEYPVSLDAFLHHPIISAAKGAPVASQPIEPEIVTNGSVLFPSNAPSPCAGMLMIDLILSDEGQNLLRDANYFPANPVVSPLEQLNPVLPTNAKVKSIFLDPALIAEMHQRSVEIYKELFR